MKFWLITIIIGITAIIFTGVGIYIYKMPYPFKVFYENVMDGPIIDTEIKSADLKIIWESLKAEMSFYELPFKVSDEEGKVLVETIISRDQNGMTRGKSYWLSFNGTSWVLEPTVGIWAIY